ncbi:hypothetical protein GAYE_SCF41G5494 [Galdieria yellowstonensis]|uniref:GTP-binding protein n=1 Tax=Galdieria yellowstonensis TaxID=3028027 RepID=A0AAV9IJT3_9RHOD|nr:hypothetical protein GAYE_SCF41G5494 [Galdieria yellowstonensis]
MDLPAMETDRIVSRPRSRRKVLLMGRSGAGKTSMRSIIFANYVPRETRRLGVTMDVEHSQIRFLGDLMLSLWDCGGQDVFLDSYLDAQRENIFSEVQLLIYVFDIMSTDVERDWYYFSRVVDCLRNSSAGAKIYCLFHKVDLVPEHQRQAVVEERKRRLKEALTDSLFSVECFATSIWDETLYKAWSFMICGLIPQLSKLDGALSKFCETCEGDEVVLFERATFLVISHATLHSHSDVHRFEKISNIVKRFKLSCNKNQSHFHSLELRNSQFLAIIENFTCYTCVLYVSYHPHVQSTAVKLNIQCAKTLFERILENEN